MTKLKSTNKLNQIITNYKIIKPADFKKLLDGESVSEINKNEKEIATLFFNQLMNENENEKTIILFRGTPLNILKDKADEIKLLFQIGEKSYHAVAKEKETIAEKTIELKNINDISSIIFEYIFDRFNHVFINIKEYPKKIKVIERFIENNNNDFVNYLMA